MNTNTTSGAAIQRYKIGYPFDDWVQRSSTPSVIPDASGSWVRYADHVTALAAGQATAAQQGAAYAAPPDERAAFEVQFPVPGGVHWDGTEYVVKDSHVSSYRCNRFEGQWEAWKARASHGQAPATAQAAESVPAREHDLQDVRCECCGYMTYHREHMGCIHAARKQ